MGSPRIAKKKTKETKQKNHPKTKIPLLLSLKVLELQIDEQIPCNLVSADSVSGYLKHVHTGNYKPVKGEFYINNTPFFIMSYIF